MYQYHASLMPEIKPRNSIRQPLLCSRSIKYLMFILRSKNTDKESDNEKLGNLFPSFSQLHCIVTN